MLWNSWKNNKIMVIGIPLLAALLIWALGVSPVWVIVATILLGVVWGKISERNNKDKQPEQTE